jgi:hypothetical protein
MPVELERRLRRLICIATVVLAARSLSAADVIGTWGVRASTPQLFSISGGVLIGEIDPPSDFKGDSSHLPHGLLIQIEPGVHGGKLSLGYAKGLPPYAGAGLKLSALRTWGRPLFTEPGQTYLGVEADASFFIKLSLGIMARINHETRAPRVIVTGGLGLGF